MSATPAAPGPSSSNKLILPDGGFQPPWLLRNAHVQTLAGAYVFGRGKHRRLSHASSSSIGEVLLDDGDRLVFHDDCPANWQPGHRVALLLHGLSGSHASPYMIRIANQLCARCPGDSFGLCAEVGWELRLRDSPITAVEPKI